MAAFITVEYSQIQLSVAVSAPFYPDKIGAVASHKLCT